MKKTVLFVSVLSLIVVGTSCKKKSEDPKPLVTTPTPVIPTPVVPVTPPDTALVVNFDFQQEGKGLVSFVNASKNDIQWSWDFGNGNTSALKVPAAQQFKENKSYVIKLTSKNANGTVRSASKTITIANIPNALFLTTLQVTGVTATWNNCLSDKLNMYIKIKSTIDGINFNDIATSSVLSNTSTGSFDMSSLLEFGTEKPTFTILIEIYDQDGGLCTDDLLTTYSFKPYDYTFRGTKSSFPTSIPLVGLVKGTLNLKWEKTH